MTAVFVDTSFYIALVNPGDALHNAAAELGRRTRGQSVTTEYVLVEVGNYLARTANKPLFLHLLRELEADPETSIVPSAHDLFEEGTRLYAQRLDKDWSLTDCISFVVMRQRALTGALTSDHHFEQAGFTVLLK